MAKRFNLLLIFKENLTTKTILLLYYLQLPNQTEYDEEEFAVVYSINNSSLKSGHFFIIETKITQ